MKNIVKSLVVIGLLGAGSMYIYLGITFNQNCSGHLKRAADASTIELAQKELKRAIDYMEQENLTKGSTHIIYATPDNDIGFWYDNIRSTYVELQNLPASSTSLEKSNMLIKLRETLLDGDEVTLPPYISLYPLQAIIMFILVVCGIGFVIMIKSK